MRIVYFRKEYGDTYAGGDAIYDRRLVAALRDSGVDVREVLLRRANHLSTIIKASVNGSHPTFHTYSTPANQAAVERACAAEDVAAAVFSHEAVCPLLFHAPVGLPKIAILHNLFSEALGEVGLHRYLRSSAGKLEARLMRAHNTQVAVLSRREQIALSQKHEGYDVLLLPPGVPSQYGDPTDAINSAVIYIGGSRAWGLKSRDFELALRRLRRELPSLEIRSADAFADDGHINVSLIADRFSAGFKLKAAEYLCKNSAIVSLTPVRSDFPERARPGSALVEVSSFVDIPAALQRLMAGQEDVRADLVRVKQDLARELSWRTIAERLSSTFQFRLAGGE